MSSSLHSYLRLVGAGLTATVLQLPAFAPAQENPEIVVQLAVLRDEGEIQKKGEEKDDEVKPTKRSYWIGITVDAGNMTIIGVYPESPALKAGLKQGDRLLSVEEKKLQGPENLGDVIAKSKGGPLNVRILRDGKEAVVKVTPVKWPNADKLRTLLNKMREESKEKK